MQSDSLQTILKTHQTEEERLVEMIKAWLTGTKPATLTDLWRLNIASIQSQLEHEGIMHHHQYCRLRRGSTFTPDPLPSDLPLHRDDLSNSERRQLTASLQQEPSDIQKKFEELLNSIIRELGNYPPIPLHLLVQKLETNSQKDTFSKVTSMQELFAIAASEDS